MIAVPPPQTPFAQVSLFRHVRPESHPLPSGLGSLMQAPSEERQTFCMHELAGGCGHATGGRLEQSPARHTPGLAQRSVEPHGESSATAVHVPMLPVCAQDMHVPTHERSQQTPSVQKPESHWDAAVQAVPFGA